MPCLRSGRALPPCLAPNFFSSEKIFDRKFFRPNNFSVEIFFGRKKLGARHGGKARPLRRQGTGNERRFLGGEAPQTPPGGKARDTISKNLPFRGKFFEMIKKKKTPELPYPPRTSIYPTPELPVPLPNFRTLQNSRGIHSMAAKTKKT